MVNSHLLRVLFLLTAAWGQSILDVAPGEASLRDAQVKVRSLLPTMNSDIHVRLHGRYDLTSPFILNENDAGRNGWRVHWESAPGEAATLSGGVLVKNWEQEGQLWKAKLSDVSLRQFFVNGRRKTRARSPNKSDSVNDGPYSRLLSWNLENASILIPSDEIPEGASDSGTEIIVHKHWNMGVLRISSIEKFDEKSSQIFLKKPDFDLNKFAYPEKGPGQVFRWENSRQFLDSPGEWYFDAYSRTLYYWPEPGETLENSEAWVPRLETIIEIQRSKSLTLSRLNIEYSAWNRIDSTGYGDDQGSIWVAGASMATPVDTSFWPKLLIPGAVTVDSSRQIRIYRCTIRHIGGQGILFGNNTNNNRITGNRIEDIAANGIALRQRYQQSSGGSASDTIDNNFLSKIGRFYSGSAAINAMYPGNIQIINNRITETPYSGISLGWDWDGFPTSAQNNTISWNDISFTNRIHDDGAGIYTLGLQPNSKISHNWIHEIEQGQWFEGGPLGALYFDQSSKGFQVFSNSLFGMDSTVKQMDLIHYGMGVSSSDVILSGNSSAHEDLRSIRGNAGPQPEIFWNKTQSDSVVGTWITNLQNIALGKTVSSPDLAIRTASLGNDGDTATAVRIAPFPENWWQIDLGGAYSIDQVSLLGTDTTNHPIRKGPSCVIQASSSSTFENPQILGAWTSAKQGLTSDWWIGADEKPPMRYLRIINNSPDTFFFSELQIRGTFQPSVRIERPSRGSPRARSKLVFNPKSGTIKILRIGRESEIISPDGRSNR